jgi:hypothetical protein
MRSNHADAAMADVLKKLASITRRTRRSSQHSGDPSNSTTGTGGLVKCLRQLADGLSAICAPSATEHNPDAASCLSSYLNLNACAEAAQVSTLRTAESVTWWGCDRESIAFGIQACESCVHGPVDFLCLHCRVSLLGSKDT